MSAELKEVKDKIKMAKILIRFESNPALPVSQFDQKLIIYQPVTFKDWIPSANTLIFLHQRRTKLCDMTDELTVPSSAQYLNAPLKVKYFNTPVFESAKIFLRGNPNFCRNNTFINGQVAFGLHQYIQGSVKYITLIQDPIECILSRALLKGYEQQSEPVKALLEQDLLDDTDNPQTKQLAGEEYRVNQLGRGVECTDKTLEIAKKNIEDSFLLASVTEDTNDFMQILSSIQHWEVFALCSPQEPDEKAYPVIPTELKRQLIEKHKYDQQLYEWVKERWYAWKVKNLNRTQRFDPKLSQEITCYPRIHYPHCRTAWPRSLREINEHNHKMALALEISIIEEALDSLTPKNLATEHPVEVVLTYLYKSDFIKRESRDLSLTKKPTNPFY